MSTFTRLFGALVAFASFAATAHAGDAYVRPTADCAFNGNGTQPTCAASNGQSGAFVGLANVTWAGMGAGDTLYIIGEHVGSFLRLQASGNATTPLTIRGDLPGYAPGVINGGGTVAQCVTQQNSNKDLSFVSLAIKNCTSLGFGFSNMADGVTHLGLQLHNVTVSNITSASGTPTCLWVRGEGIVIKNSRFSGCKDDGVWVHGTNVTIENNWFDGIGIDSANHADCVQLAFASNDFRLRGNTCNHTLPNSKQCFIVNTDSHTGSSHGEITDNVCFMPTYDGVHEMKGIFNIHPNVLIARNFVTGGKQGIWQVGTNGTVAANVVTAVNDAGIYVGLASTNTVINNTVVGGYGTGKCLLSASNSTFINNVLSGCQYPMGSTSGMSQWVSNLVWDNVFNVPNFSNATNNPVTNPINQDPGFSGTELYDADAWQISTTTAGSDVSSYGTPAMLDFNKDPRSSGMELGAFTP